LAVVLVLVWLLGRTLALGLPQLSSLDRLLAWWLLGRVVMRVRAPVFLDRTGALV
jgi:hypothetical protein